MRAQCYVNIFQSTGTSVSDLRIFDAEIEHAFLQASPYIQSFVVLPFTVLDALYHIHHLALLSIE
jgi:hypothetical protein